MRNTKDTVASVDVGEARSHELLPWTEESPEANRRTAVLAVHGMGQQMAFSTLADVAEELSNRGDKTAKPVARNVVFANGSDGTTRTSRMELHMSGYAEVHVYEAYWAPLTEGTVTLRNVLAFLLYAGFSNMRRTGFSRYLFGERKWFPVDLRGTLVLYVAILTVLSLLVVNTVLSLAVLIRLPDVATWPSDALVIDLSVVAALVSIFALCLGVMIRLASHVKQYSTHWSMRRWLTRIVWAELGVLLLVLIGAAAAMLWAVYWHRWPNRPSVAWCLLGRTRLDALADFSWKILAVLAGIAVLSRIAKSAWLSRALLVVTVLVNGIVIALIYRWLTTWAHADDGPGVYWEWAWVWLISFVVSVFARQFLVQYVGDVAAYVQPHRLDRFHTIREQIKQCVYDTADAVYRAADEHGKPLYDRIVIVAHSLGSVAAYDALNTLLRIDAARGGHINVLGRTRALITFGSPLDKIAMLFGKQHGMETEEALAASIQPLIQDPARPDWVNIHSPSDIISGALDYFGNSNLTNLVDQDATTPLAAHTEYWKNNLLWWTLFWYL